MSYAAIMARCLARVPGNIDKREGSLIYDALAPAAAELAQAFLKLATLKDDLAFPDTAAGENLTKKASERGVFRMEATRATRRALFWNGNGQPMDVPAESRFSGGGENYRVVEKLEAGVYRVQCETAGTVGNRYFGALVPINFIQGLARAELSDVLVPGEDEETDEALRARYYDSLAGIAFGGNVRDYTRWAKGLPGVGGVKVYPIWNGGGSVRLAIISSAWDEPSAELVDMVQTAMDPEVNQGRGDGIAPIGHTVTVTGVDSVAVDVEMDIQLQAGHQWADVKPLVEEVIAEYLLELSAEWDKVEAVLVRISQIETRVLGLDAVMDVGDTTLNSAAENLELGGDEIPILGAVNKA